MPKKMQVITYVPMKTLGDAYSAKKLLDRLANEDVEIEWVILRDKPIEGLEVPPNVKIKYAESCEKIDSRNAKDFDVFMIYPQIPISVKKTGEQTPSEPLVKFLQSLPQDRILLTCSDYNASDSIITIHDALDNYYPTAQHLQTGFDELGLFMNAKESDAVLSNNLKAKAPNTADIVFRGQSETDYFEHNELYLGYVNTSIDKAIVYDNKVDRENFVIACIRDAIHANKSSSTPKNIEIVVDLDQAAITSIYKKLTPEERAILGKVEITVQSEKKNYLLKQPDPNAKQINLRIINAFPMPNQGMLYLIAKSNPLIMLTGNQSFSEGLSNYKLVCYQIMQWNEKMFHQFLGSVEKFCIENNLGGKDALLYRFYAPQIQPVHGVNNQPGLSKTEYWKQALEFYHQHRVELLSQQEKFSKHLLAHDNLYQTFAPAVMSVLNLNPLIKSIFMKEMQNIHKELAALDKPVDDIRDAQGNTALMVALKNKNRASIEAIYAVGAKLDVANRKGETPLLVAMRSASVDNVQWILENHSSIDKKSLDYAILHANSYNKNLNEISSLVIRQHYSNLVKSAIGTQPISDYINSIAPNINEATLHGESILILAAKGNRADLISELAKQPLDVNQVDKDGMSAFLLAVRLGNIETVKTMLETMPLVNLNQTDNSGNNALHLAARYGHDAIAELICKHNPKLMQATNQSNQSPLLIAVETNNEKVLRTLMSHCEDKQAEFKRQYADRGTLLHKAATLESVNMIKVLTELGMPADTIDAYNRTPLMYWVSYRGNFPEPPESLEVPALLLRRGANPTTVVKAVDDLTQISRWKVNSWTDLKKIMDEHSLAHKPTLFSHPETSRQLVGEAPKYKPRSH